MANTIFVTNDNVQKRRDYEDYVVKVFYIKNATTVQELQELSTTIRSVTEIRRAFTYNAQWAILVRGTADQVAMAEKLVQDLDKPKSEVIVDIIVMEANRTESVTWRQHLQPPALRALICRSPTTEGLPPLLVQARALEPARALEAAPALEPARERQHQRHQVAASRWISSNTSALETSRLLSPARLCRHS